MVAGSGHRATNSSGRLPDRLDQLDLDDALDRPERARDLRRYGITAGKLHLDLSPPFLEQEDQADFALPLPGKLLLDADERRLVPEEDPYLLEAADELVERLDRLDAQIDALQAQANQAQIDFTRTEGLVERGTLPRVKLDETRTALNVAENGMRAKTAERAVVNQQLTEGQVLAPDDGRVLKKLVTVGSVVLPGDAIATVAQQNFKLRLRVPERHAMLLKAGDKIRVDGAEFGDNRAKWGVIDLVYPQIEDGRVIADATVEGLGDYFVGERLRVWISGGARQAFVIPSSYVKTRFGIDYVAVRQGSGTIETPVQRGRDIPTSERPNGLEILSGLRVGDQLVQP